MAAELDVIYGQIGASPVKPFLAALSLAAAASLPAQAQVITEFTVSTDVASALFNPSVGLDFDGRAFNADPGFNFSVPFFQYDSVWSDFNYSFANANTGVSIEQASNEAWVSVGASSFLSTQLGDQGYANALGLASFGAISTAGTLDFNLSWGVGSGLDDILDGTGFNSSLVLVSPIGKRPFWFGDASAVSLLPILADWDYRGHGVGDVAFNAQGAQFVAVAANRLFGFDDSFSRLESDAYFNVKYTEVNVNVTYTEVNVPEAASLGLWALGGLLLIGRSKRKNAL